MTCNDCGRDINFCDRYGCREVNGVAWAMPEAKHLHWCACRLGKACNCRATSDASGSGGK